MRSVYFDRKIGKPTPLDFPRIFNCGRVLEDWWIDFLNRKKNLAILDVNLPCRHINPFYRIHERVDVLLQYEYNKIEVHEIKTIKSFGP